MMTETKRTLSPAQREFALAMKNRRKQTGRYFPKWAEVLTVIEGLGYRRPCTRAEREFQVAMTAWKRRAGTNFPKWSDVFDVLLGIGYVRPGKDDVDHSGAACRSPRSGEPP